MIYARPKPLGLVPAIIGGAVLIESAWAWYDPDFFMTIWLEADEEERVIQVNNWWVELETTGRATLAHDDFVWTKLYGDVGQWVKWKAAYNDATLRRWLPGGRDWGAELEVWFQKLREMSSAVAQAGGVEAERRIAAKGLDPRLLPEADKGFLERAQEALKETIEDAGTAAERAGGAAGTGLFWPAMALGGSMAILLWLATRD